MNDAIKLTEAPPVRRAKRPGRLASMHPAYPSLLALVLVVGTASLIALCANDFCLENRAMRGDAKALYLLGKRYFENPLTPRDYERAARLVRRAAEQGYTRAEAGLGIMYENGLGVPKDYAEALRWLRRAAAKGLPVAQNELGVMYARGFGVARNLNVAAKWCRLAAAQGSEVAQRNLQLAEVGSRRVIPELALPGNTSYKRVVLQRVEADGVTVSYVPTHGGVGVAKVKSDVLPTELRDLCRYASKQGAAPDSAYSQIGSVSTTL